MGVWLPESRQRFKMWTWFWDFRDKVLYKKHGGGYLKYNNTNIGRITRAGQNGFTESHWVPADTIEDRLERTTVTIVNNIIFPEGSAPIQE